MNAHELTDRIIHPERHPEGPRSGLPGALAASLDQARRRNQQLADGFTAGFKREHPELDSEHLTREQVEELAGAALGRLLERRRSLSRQLADDLAAEQKGTTS